MACTPSATAKSARPHHLLYRAWYRFYPGICLADAIATPGSLLGAALETSSLRFLRLTSDTTLKAIFLEDTAALIGLVLAGAGLSLSHRTGSSFWDGLA